MGVGGLLVAQQDMQGHDKKKTTPNNDELKKEGKNICVAPYSLGFFVIRINKKTHFLLKKYNSICFNF